MEASAAAASFIEEYKGRKNRFGSQKAPQKTVKVRPNKAIVVLLLPLLIVPCLFLWPSEYSNGYATRGRGPMPNARIVLTSEDGSVYRAKANDKGEFRVCAPEGTYDASLEEGVKGPRGLKLRPGMNFRVEFPKGN